MTHQIGSLLFRHKCGIHAFIRVLYINYYYYRVFKFVIFGSNYAYEQWDCLVTPIQLTLAEFSICYVLYNLIVILLDTPKRV